MLASLRQEIPSVFQVDADCIRHGERTMPDKCIIALSVEKAGAEDPSIGEKGILFLYKGVNYFMSMKEEDIRE